MCKRDNDGEQVSVSLVVHKNGFVTAVKHLNFPYSTAYLELGKVLLRWTTVNWNNSVFNFHLKTLTLTSLYLKPKYIYIFYSLTKPFKPPVSFIFLPIRSESLTSLYYSIRLFLADLHCVCLVFTIASLFGWRASLRWSLGGARKQQQWERVSHLSNPAII